MEKYEPKKIERKWQSIWGKIGIFRASDHSKKPKFYLLVEFPYPSGEGLHVGHCRSYVGLDVLARKKRMQGFNVLFPMGWDAFGLPTENYALKTGIRPAVVTKKNTAVFKRQEKELGLSFDWSREINTSYPDYYKWTQWIFLQLFKKDLAYKAKMPINWCLSCKIGLANEEVVDGKCERCGGKVIKKEKEQWLLKITEYAERLIKDLDLVDYPERVKISQKEWIGKSEGAEVKFQIPIKELSSLRKRNLVPLAKFEISVFTTRPDTIFGTTAAVISPENPLVPEVTTKNRESEVKEYLKRAKIKNEFERTKSEKEKTGVFSGSYCLNPANDQKVPIWIGDYVVSTYGGGAVMMVPAHDKRDYQFAKKYNLPIVEVIKPATETRVSVKNRDPGLCKSYEGEGVLTNSGQFNGLKSEEAGEKIIEWLAGRGLGRKAIHYKLRDWIFSRQRYWGEPIPMVNCQKCSWQPVAEKDLPVKLPKIKEYKPTEKGESPLAKVENWVNVKCPKCAGPAKRETDVMPNWAGSNWYYLRYCDPRNNKRFAGANLLKKWMPIDWYNGGMEHTTLHLLYSRFIYKFLWDIGAVPREIGPEPYKKRTSQGMVLGEGGIKMSKSKGNVVNPQEVVKEYGADAMRVYEMFMGPFEQAIPWDIKGLRGVKRFLEKVWKLRYKANYKLQTKNYKLQSLIHRTIKKVGDDIENLKFNTAISALMILANELEKQKEICRDDFSIFLILLSPFAPHISEELWSRTGLGGLCCKQKWPEYDKKLIREEKIILVVQVNGKVRDKIEVGPDISKKEAEKIALSQEKIKKWLIGKEIKKTIFISGKLINFVAIDKK